MCARSGQGRRGSGTPARDRPRRSAWSPCPRRAGCQTLSGCRTPRSRPPRPGSVRPDCLAGPVPVRWSRPDTRHRSTTSRAAGGTSRRSCGPGRRRSIGPADPPRCRRCYSPPRGRMRPARAGPRPDRSAVRPGRSRRSSPSSRRGSHRSPPAPSPQFSPCSSARPWRRDVHRPSFRSRAVPWPKALQWKDSGVARDDGAREMRPTPGVQWRTRRSARAPSSGLSSSAHSDRSPMTVRTLPPSTLRRTQRSGLLGGLEATDGATLGGGLMRPDAVPGAPTDSRLPTGLSETDGPKIRRTADVSPGPQTAPWG